MKEFIAVILLSRKIAVAAARAVTKEGKVVTQRGN